VDVRQIVVSGTVVGAIVASESVKLMSTARVVGDLASPRVMMEAGAAYRGRVDMGDIAAARAAVSSRAAQRPAAGEKAALRPAPPRWPCLARRSLLARPRRRSCLPLPYVLRRRLSLARLLLLAAAFPRVAGAMGAMVPAWAKKKIRRR